MVLERVGAPTSNDEENRSNDDDEYVVSHIDSTASQFSQVNAYYGPVPFNATENESTSHKGYLGGDASVRRSLSYISLDSRAYEEVPKSDREGLEHYILDEAPSLHVAEDVGTEPLDLEKNGFLWLPPDPEDEDEREGLLFEFLPFPSDHQSILVYLSSWCLWKGTVCERPHLDHINDNFDEPLGHFLQNHLFDQNYICSACEMPAEAHAQCYIHRQGTLTVSVKKLPEILLDGEMDGEIWMWHRCLKCPRANGFPPITRRVEMSDAAWGLSFEKFLELSFSNHATVSRVASCGHSLHRDCLQFYGSGEMVACFRYAPISVNSVYLPPLKLGFKFESQKWVEKELTEVTVRAEIFFSKVLNVLRLLVERQSGLCMLKSGMRNPESRLQISDLVGILHKENSEFEESLKKIFNKELGEGPPAIDILELNQLRRQLVDQSYAWDDRLLYAASSETMYRVDALEFAILEPVQEPLGATDINVPVKTGKSSGSSDLTAAESNSDHGVSSGTCNNLHEGVHESVDACSNSDRDPNPPTPFVGMNIITDSDASACRVPFGGQTSICLSDILDAAWTGDTHTSIGITKNSSFSTSEAEELYSTRVSEEDLSMSKVSQSPPVLSAKCTDNMEDTVSCLGMSITNFYRSPNKIILGSTQKLEKLGEHDPVCISSFWDIEQQHGARFLLPVGVNDTVVPIYDDEPTSIISYALASPEYLLQVSNESKKAKDMAEYMFSMQSHDAGILQSFHSLDKTMLEPYRNLPSGSEGILSLNSRSSLPLDPLSYTKAFHAEVSFEDNGLLGKVKYNVTCYYTKQFEALRRIWCPFEVDFIRSLSRCEKWGAQGGKSNVFFSKTLDECFIIKQVTKAELESFFKFAPEYFKYLSESISTASPTCLAKILGIYQVSTKHLNGGKEMKMDVLVMENLMYGRNLTQLYDLNGSCSSRYNPNSSGSNKVLLDQNLIEAMPTSPICVGNKAKKLLERAVWNDTAFLASIGVTDYSILVGVDEEKCELVVGIINFMKQYTWDKHLESWVKALGNFGGRKSVSPEQYKTRFRKAITAYFLMIPDQ